MECTLSVAGDSAGGNLAAALTLKLRDSGQDKDFQFKYQILLYPLLQGESGHPRHGRLSTGPRSPDNMFKRWLWGRIIPRMR